MQADAAVSSARRRTSKCIMQAATLISSTSGDNGANYMRKVNHGMQEKL